MRTTYVSDKVLNLYRATNFTAPTTVYAGLLTAVTDHEAGTVTEAAYTGYARQAITFGAPGAGGGGRKMSSSAGLTFPAALSGPTTVMAVGIYDASSAGNLLDVLPIDGNDAIGISVEAADLASDLVTSPSHGLAAGQQVRIEAYPAGQTLPAPIAEDTNYFVIATGLTTDQFKISTTLGGGALDITAVGRGILSRFTPVIINTTDTPQVASAAMVLYDD